MTTPNPQPTDRQLSLAHFDDHPRVRDLKSRLTTEDLLDVWEAVSNWVEEAEDFVPDDAQGLTPEELKEIRDERETNDRMDALMHRLHDALKIIPQDLR